MKSIPLFPLEIVVFPGEQVPLHIFEQRYISMINHCMEADSPFGIVSYVDNSISDVGSLVYVNSVTKTYDDGKMDIECQATERFITHERETSQPYLQGSVELFSDEDQEQEDEEIGTTGQLLQTLKKRFDELMQMACNELSFDQAPAPTRSFEFAHLVGLDLKQKLKLLEMRSEHERLQYLNEHLTSILPQVKSFGEFKKLIRQNGHVNGKH